MNADQIFVVIYLALVAILVVCLAVVAWQTTRDPYDWWNASRKEDRKK